MDKTVTMFFNNGTKHLINPNVYINSKIVEKVDEFCYLGVTWDLTNIQNYIKKLKNTLRFDLVNFRYIRGLITTEATDLYLNSMILTHFQYCMSNLSHCCKKVKEPLESLYNYGVKINDKKSRPYHHY